MTRTSLLAITLAGALCGAAFAQNSSPPPASSSTVPPAPSTTGPSTTAKDAGASKAQDPSSTRGRPDAQYPNPSGQDTRTDAAAKAHTEKGHDHAANQNVVKPTPSAGPTGGKDAYTASSGKKPDPQTECEAATSRSSEGSPPTAGADKTRKVECTDERPMNQGSQSRRATAPPPGATAPVNK
jgi:hypothetical protein